MSINGRDLLFYTYRYFIIHSGQLSFIGDLEGSPNKIAELISVCKKNKKIEVDVNGRRSILLYKHEYDEHISLFKFCRNYPITRYELDEVTSDIIERQESNFPFIYILIDTERQIILLEKKASIFPKMETAKNAFISFIESFFHDINYTYSMDEIIEKSDFWEYINIAENIYQLDLNLKSPNFFGCLYKTSDLLKSVKKDFNNDETNLIFKNKHGNLTVTKDGMDDALEYAGSGGGNWALHIKKSGGKRKIIKRSKDSIKVIEIADFEEEYRFIPIESIKSKMRSIDDLIE